MQASVMQWLAGFGWTAFTWAIAGLILLNVGAFAMFRAQRNRHVVERYTSLWLAGNLVLLAIGVGVPAVTAVARLALLGAGTLLPDVPFADG
jgi:hypothetical protein